MTQTFQSVRRKRQRQMPPMWRPAFDAWRARDETRRRALPERAAEPQAGKPLMRWQIAGNGWTHDVLLLQPADRGTKRPRSDQFVLVIDDEVVLALVGMVQIMEHLCTKVLPRQMTCMQCHQADCVAEACDMSQCNDD